MSRQTSSIYLALLAIISCLGFALFLPAQAQAEKECARVERWLKQNEGNLPRTYEELSILPVTYRRAVFGTLPAEEKSELWRNHLTTYLEAHSDLTSRQRKLIEKAIDMVTPEMFSSSPRDPRWEKLVFRPSRALELQAKKVFQPEQIQEIFAQLGPSDLDDRQPFLEKLQEDNGGEQAEASACSCATTSPYCPTNYWCYYRQNNCTIIRDQCGTFWTHHCNGHCISQ